MYITIVCYSTATKTKIVRRISGPPVLGALPIDEPRQARRTPSPAKNTMSRIIHIRQLVRPYTLGQLKELLGRTGTLASEGFWIDKIKSHCIATVSVEMREENVVLCVVKVTCFCGQSDMLLWSK